MKIDIHLNHSFEFESRKVDCILAFLSSSLRCIWICSESTSGTVILTSLVTKINKDALHFHRAVCFFLSAVKGSKFYPLFSYIMAKHGTYLHALLISGIEYFTILVKSILFLKVQVDDKFETRLLSNPK